MKYFIIIFIVFIVACNNENKFEFPDDSKLAFYVYAENGKPAYVYIGESASIVVGTLSELPELDTLQTELKLFETGFYKEDLHTKDSIIISHYPDTVELYNNGIAYESNTILEPNIDYTFDLQYKDYPKISLNTKIPQAVPIDSITVNPNLGYAYDNFYVVHNLTLNFNAPADADIHYLIGVFINYTDTAESIEDEFSWKYKIIEDENIIRNGLNSISYEFFSKRRNGYGDFIPTAYLFSVSDGYYEAFLKHKHYDDYIEAAGFFDHTTSYIPYSMVENAYANIFASSYTTKSSGEVIHIIEPNN